MTDFTFDDVSSNRYGNNPMDNLLAGEMKSEIPLQQHQQQQRSQNRQQENFQAEKQYQQQQQQNLVDVTEKNTLANAKNIGYDPSEYMVVEDNNLSSINDVNLFVRIMLGLILFFQLFIIFRMFAQNSN